MGYVRLIVTPTNIGIIKTTVKPVLLIVSLVPARHRAKPVQPEKEFSMDSVLLALRELLWTMVFANAFVLPLNISIIKDLVSIVRQIARNVMTRDALLVTASTIFTMTNVGIPVPVLLLHQVPDV